MTGTGPDPERTALDEAVAAVRAHSQIAPRCGIVLGSGLGGLADEIDAEAVVPVRTIPHFPVPTAEGHAGELVLGPLDGRPVAVLRGRVHLYEGYTAREVVFPVRLLAALGTSALILSNAAGALNPAFQRGDLMLLTDHINVTGTNPLVGPNDDRFGPRFPDMSHVYDSSLRALAEAAARADRTALRAGVYAGVLGPSYETPAEIRMLRALGADAVGMSTVLEAIAARHAGMRVLGIAVITNAAARGPARDRTEGTTLSHQDVLAAAAAAGPRFVSLVRSVVRGLPRADGDGRVPPV
ncbi:MAG TPA: purine-nucleoside phosphorylase [bacterium]|nr:purine-nucleoside phosphorylase [bacterium]